MKTAKKSFPADHANKTNNISDIKHVNWQCLTSVNFPEHGQFTPFTNEMDAVNFIKTLHELFGAKMKVEQQGCLRTGCVRSRNYVLPVQRNYYTMSQKSPKTNMNDKFTTGLHIGSKLHIKVITA
jgi:hypothetical protein